MTNKRNSSGKRGSNNSGNRRNYSGGKQQTSRKPISTSRGKTFRPKKSDSVLDDKVRLNKLIANAGFCSRREADTLIATGIVTVNGKTVTEMGYKVSPEDVVKFDGVTVKRETKRYVLVNKPEAFGIKPDANPNKRTLAQLLKNNYKETLEPVGKMSKTYSGLMLFTNDRDLQRKLSNADIKVSQLFHLTLDKDFSEADLEKLTNGIFVDNRMFNAEEASFVSGRPHNEIGVKILTGNTNMIKYMIGKLNYKIEKLDRVEFSGLTKLDLPRGHHRDLTEKELVYLKMLS